MKNNSEESFWKNGFTIDETKFSTLMFLLIIAFTYLLVANVLNEYQYTDKIFDVVKWLIGGIVGVNGIDAFTGSVFKNNDYDDLK